MSVQLFESPDVFRESLERLVHTRTGGMVRELRVDVLRGEVVISGRASSYYTKQLATHAALSSGESVSVSNEIEVG